MNLKLFYPFHSRLIELIDEQTYYVLVPYLRLKVEDLKDKEFQVQEAINETIKQLLVITDPGEKLYREALEIFI